MLIQNGVVHTMEGLVIENGLWPPGTAKSLPSAPCPPLPVGADGPVIDAAGGPHRPGFCGRALPPGYVWQRPGLFEALTTATSPPTPALPHLRAIDAVNPPGPILSGGPGGGVTTVLTGPGSANPIAGQFAALQDRRPLGGQR